MLLEITTNLDEFITRIEAARELLLENVAEAMASAGEELVQQLSNYAPKGTGAEGEPPAGDAAGRLAESFEQETTAEEASVHLVVSTQQPQKLEWVRFGTGIFGPMGQRIYPKVKKALYWPSADHPYRSIAGMEPNDFVSPVIDSAEELILERLDEALMEVTAEL